MCVASLGVALGAQAGTAAASTLGLTAISTAVGMVSSAVGIMQAQSQAAFAQQQANTQHVNMQLQAQNDRKGQMYDHIARINAANASGLATQKGIFNSQMAANRGMVAKQLERKQAADQAAFQSLDIYRKQIGSRGKVLAAGVTGQSVGLMALDAERQAGFAKAKVTASQRSADFAMANAMETLQIQDSSRQNQLLSAQLPSARAPLFAQMPVGPKPLGLGIPQYDFG